MIKLGLKDHPSPSVNFEIREEKAAPMLNNRYFYRGFIRIVHHVDPSFFAFVECEHDIQWFHKCILLEEGYCPGIVASIVMWRLMNRAMTSSLDPQENEFIFSYCSLDDPIRIKERIREALNDVLRGDGFTVARVRVLGTHSVRKFAVTFACGNGCSKVRCVFILIIFMNMLIFVYYFLCFLHPFTG
jgi:hypothetical protein